MSAGARRPASRTRPQRAQRRHVVVAEHRRRPPPQREQAGHRLAAPLRAPVAMHHKLLLHPQAGIPQRPPQAREALRIGLPPEAVADDSRCAGGPSPIRCRAKARRSPPQLAIITECVNSPGSWLFSSTMGTCIRSSTRTYSDAHARRRHDDAVHAALLQRADHAAVPAPRSACEFASSTDSACSLAASSMPFHHAGGERVGDRGHHHPDGVRPLRHQAPGRGAQPVAGLDRPASGSRAAVFGFTSGLLRRARETVECETFAIRAMSLIEVGRIAAISRKGLIANVCNDGSSILPPGRGVSNLRPKWVTNHSSPGMGSSP
jgi:hypothetical protein